MEKTIFRIIILLLFSLITFSGGDSLFSIECRHTFDLNLNLAQILDLNTSTTIRVINSFMSEIFVKSPCCKNISFASKGMKCSLCSENGIKVCNISEETINISGIDQAECERKSVINLSCTSRICPSRNNTENNEVFRPGEETGCFTNNKSYTCSKYGNWTSTDCLHEALLTSTLYSTHETITSSEKTSALTAGNMTDHGNKSVDLLTSTDPSNITDQITLYTIDKLMRGPDVSNETIFEEFQTEKAMKALYTFLIVLGVVLVLVTILVCGFFIRKKKDKVSISHVDYPLEYWHDREYVDNIVNKQYTPKSTFTVNPVFDNKSFGQTRYKKKEESDYKKRRNSASKDQNRDGNEKPRRSNAFRTVSNGSVSSNTDRTKKTKHDYTDKYLATATGSNFYNYNPTQTQDVVKKTTDLDVSTEDECDLGHPTDQLGTSSFTSPKVRAKQKGKRGTKGEPNNHSDGHCPDVIEDNLYSMSYKEHLRRSLDYWSAEESDA